jgi:acetoin utilization protein AcuB
MIVRMYMTKDVEVISPDASLADAIKKMTQRKIRRLVVAREDVVVGMVTQGELIQAFPHNVNPFSPLGLEEKAALSDIGSVMTQSVVTVDENAPVELAAALMTKHHIGGLPVTRNGKLVGIITESDIFRALSKLLSDHDNAVRITFDLTEGEDVVGFLVEKARMHDLKLLSFISFHEDDRRMAVARVRGDKVRDLINDLWESGHRVVNILETN